LYLSANTEKAPLVIILHGFENTKQAHSFQAMHLASWGLHTLAVQLPNHGPWTDNGKTLAKIVNFIARRPEILDRRVDASRIILAGHSFGGTSVAVALSEKTPAMGGILLDPATSGRNLPAALQKITAPVIVLGADEHLSLARNRDYFYRYIRAGIGEVSLKGATHEDAQYPAETAQSTEEMQITFASALTAAAFSLGATGKFDYAWASFGDAIDSGKFFNAKKK
jgi:pimeloyl-ACP methyl ester carboxylesterase